MLSSPARSGAHYRSNSTSSRFGRATRESGETGCGRHPISDLEAGYILANRLDRPCTFGTQHGGVFIGRSESARAKNDFQPVEPNCTDLQLQFVGRRVLEPYLFEAEALLDHRVHEI